MAVNKRVMLAEKVLTLVTVPQFPFGFVVVVGFLVVVVVFRVVVGFVVVVVGLVVVGLVVVVVVVVEVEVLVVVFGGNVTLWF